MRAINPEVLNPGVYKKIVRIAVIAVFLAGVLPGLHAQTEIARLDIGRREALPDFFEYSGADGGLVTFGSMSAKTSRFLGITKYDSSFTREWSKQVIEQNGRKKVDFLAVLGENIFVFYSEPFPKENTIKTSFCRYDLEGNELEKDKVIAETPDIKEERVDLNYSLSLNKRKLLCYKNQDNEKGNEAITFFVFNEDGEMESDGKINIPYRDNEFEIRKVLLANSGDVFVLGKKFPKGKIENPDDYSFEVYRYEPETDTYSETVVPTRDKFITDLNMKVDRKNHVYLAGFYSDEGPSGIIGTLYCHLDENLEMVVSETQRFSEEFLAKFLSERQIDRGKEMSYFYLDNIILRSDGGVLLVAEKFYVTYNSYVDIYGYWVDQKIYHYDDIIVNSVSSDGTLEWSAAVPKIQSSDVRSYLSYTDIVSADSLYLIYGYQPRKQVQTLYQNGVSMDGIVSERKPLLDHPDGGEFFLPRESAQISNTEALLVYFSPRNKIYTFLKVSF